MGNDIQSDKTPCESVHGKSHILAEISYMDSLNDYREALPLACLSSAMGELVMLDALPRTHRFVKWDRIRARLSSAIKQLLWK
jgi:hypothetical protein